MIRLIRSLIFVPGNNPRFLEKAKSLKADIVCFDLEDSVPLIEKQKARDLIKEILKTRKDFSSLVYVRTNSPISGLIPKDLNSIIQKGIDGIVIPKVNNTSELRRITQHLTKLEKSRNTGKLQIFPSIESAEGVVNAYQIASFSKQVSGLVFGVFDLLNDMQIEYRKQHEGAKYSRAKIPIDARAAGKIAIDAIWQDLKDIEGLENDCQIGKDIGYTGKSIIHPDQIEITHRIFHPTQSEIEWATKVCQAYEISTKKGKGATVVDDKMIDEVHYKQAKSLLGIVSNSATQ